AYLIDAAGNSSELFDTADGTYLSRSFASGPLDANAGDELAFCSRNGDIYALTATGNPVFRTNFNTLFIYTPVLADVDGNGTLEVIAGGMDGMVYAVSASGALLPGFPFAVGGAFQTELAAADLNNDNAFEIIAGGADGVLYVISAGGNVMPGFPMQLDGALTGAPTITNRGLIVCGTATSIYIINSIGEIVFQGATDTHITGGFALGDVDQDHVDQEIVGISLSGKLYVFNDEGDNLPGFPLETGANFSCPPLLANLDSDPQLEILVHSYVNSVYGYNHDGSVLSGFPFISSYNGSTPGTLVDFDGNNNAKLVLGHSNGVMMLNLRTAATGLAPWTIYRGSSLRQGSFAATGFVGSEDELDTPAVTALSQNYPNPFFGETTIAYSLKQDARVQVEIYNLRGQKVYSRNLNSQKAGTHQLQWDGKDNNGLATASGIYLYKLNVNGESFTRRMLRLK
ncbi:MAG: T9SS type A sorting domain-containing protein, partial [Candidatus Cloacimonetes bacterium]|nr:T9SS type A sorting domain-containing protein [Candidatus Cloacimonadota bacterium]